MKRFYSIAAVYLVCFEAIPTPAVASEPIDRPPTAQLAEPNRAMRPSNITSETRSRLVLNARCRAILEYAQLGEFDDAGLEQLRRTCG